MAKNEKEIGEALQAIAEQLHALEVNLAKLSIGLNAVKALVACQWNPNDPTQALRQIQTIEELLTKLDPGAAARQQFGDVLDAIRKMEKHGGAKQA